MKLKRGPLNKIELYYLENNPENKSAKELADELNRSVPQVTKALEKAQKEAEKNAKKEIITGTRPEPYINSLIGKKIRNEQVVATVMTQAASEFADDQRKQHINKNPNDAIFKPKG